MTVSASRNLNDLLAGSWRWIQLHPNWALSIVTVAVLFPFLAKPYNMDDPLFIWIARQIHAHPADPYGFEVNWYGTVMPMSQVTMNPPLASYYLVLGAGILGWSEAAVHCVFLLPAVVAILGTYRLARQFCARPLLAAAMTLFTPVFLVSSTTAMCDVMMLALWIWAVVFWTEGISGKGAWRLVLAGCFVAAAVVTKYFAVCLVPLLLIHGLLARRRIGWWMGSLLLPIAALCLYHFAMQSLYGRALLFDAVSYAKLPATATQFFEQKAGNLLLAMTFTGGCLAVVAFFLPLVWRGPILTAGALILALLSVVLLLGSGILRGYGPIQGSSKLLIGTQIIVWGVGGAGVVALAVAEMWRRRDAESWLFGLWVAGTLAFAAFLNWTVNGRTILPMAPAAAILLVRRLERKFSETGTFRPRSTAVCMTAGAALALLVTRADYAFAAASRESARLTYSKYAQGTERFWFQGHWGFQHYLESWGASALDMNRTVLFRGDIIATPENNTNFSPLGPDLVVLREIITVSGPRFLVTMKGEVGGGFYAASRGPLPFAFGWATPERIVICTVNPLTPPSRTSSGKP